METSTRSLWLVDAYNVLRVSLAELSRLQQTGLQETELHPSGLPSADSPQTAWWGAEQRSALMLLAARLPEPSAEVCLVFDARHLSQRPPQPSTLPADAAPLAGEASATSEMSEELAQPVRLRVIFTPSADDWIVEGISKRRGGFARTVVVTADRRLANRARSRGAEVVATDRFVDLCRGEPAPPARSAGRVDCDLPR